MSGRISYLERITRARMRAEPEARFVFGDNAARAGLGGQAREMRGEPNAIGIPTKWFPSMREEAFFADGDGEAIIVMTSGIDLVLEAIREGRIVYAPSDGIGTGLSELPQRAPRLYGQLVAFFNRLPGEPCLWPHPPSGEEQTR